jgi:hypothetical protein
MHVIPSVVVEVLASWRFRSVGSCNMHILIFAVSQSVSHTVCESVSHSGTPVEYSPGEICYALARCHNTQFLRL